MKRIQAVAFLAAGILVLGAGRSDAVVRYVDVAATGANDGSSWGNAFTSLQGGLAVAAALDQVWVAKGTYRTGPTRDDSFEVPDKVLVYGGFTNGMATLAERNPAQYATILSGDVSANDTAGFGFRGENAYNVIRLSTSTLRRDIRIDGFVITGGNADNNLAVHVDGSSPLDAGGALVANTAPNLMVANCVFADNSAQGSGAIWLRRCTAGEIVDCTFSGNRATLADTGYGSGAIGGSGNNNGTHSNTVRRCYFTGNTSATHGGVTYDTSSQWPINFINCVMAGNTTATGGGALYLRNGTNWIINCTIAGNSLDGITVQGTTNVYVRNTIIWTNDALGGSEVSTSGGGNLTPAFSDINRAAYAGFNGNIQATPGWLAGTSATWSAAGTFATVTRKTTLTRGSAAWTVNAFAGQTLNPDTAQKLQFLISSNSATQLYVWGDASGIAGIGDTFRIWNFQLGAGSPCIDTGTNLPGVVTNDIAFAARPMGGGTDMGAYESTATGSVAGVIYVDDTAIGGNNGTAWQHAFTNLQSALGVATLGNQIWVAGGTYKPGAARASTFVLVNRVPVYGGFAGTESSPSQRNIKGNPTILSGDVDNNDTANFGNRANNAYHVVTDNTFSKDVRLDGFVVRGGNADAASDAGSVFAESGQGGGLFSVAASNMVVANCVFIDNTAVGGGAVYVKQPRANWITFQDTVFSGNRATEGDNNRGGGAVSGHGQVGIPGYLYFDRCVFTGNRAPTSSGGALGTDNANPLESRFVNCLIAGNLSGFDDGGGPQGGGLFLRSGPAIIFNSTLAYNQPYGFTAKGMVVTGQNVLVWNNITSEQLLLPGGSFSAKNCDIDESGYDGVNGSIRQDPQWVGSSNGVITTVSYAPATGLSTLNATAAWMPGQFAERAVNPDTTQNQQFWILTNSASALTIWGDVTAVGAGSADPFRIYDYHTSNSSPCVDAGFNPGAPDLDLESAVRPFGFGADIGAYELGGSALFPDGMAFVDRDATAGANNGTSWADAYTNLQTALANVPGGRQIWVAEGTYKPGASTNSTFLLKANVPVYGGFAGTETSESSRDPSTRLTILSGDLLGDDGNDNLITAPHAARDDNALHVVTGVDNATLDGFSIIGGYAYNASDAEFGGGGLYVNGTSPTIVDCKFIDNYGRKGGAISILGVGAAPTIERCTFAGNWAENGGALYSAGAPTINRCVFAGSTASNVVTSTGGALYFEGAAQPLVQNCLLVGNYSGFDGAIRVDGNIGSNRVRIVNCTIARNTGDANGAIFIKRPCQPQIQNSILWRNDTLVGGGADEIGIDAINPGSVVVTYSDVSGGYAGAGNVNTNPLFLVQFTNTWTAVSAFNPATRQTTLTRAGAGWGANQLVGFVVNPNTNQWRHFPVVSNTSTSLVVLGNAQLVAIAGNNYIAQDYDIGGNSPVIDIGNGAGAPNRDLEGDPRPSGGGFDMGAYEFQSLTGLGLQIYVK